MFNDIKRIAVALERIADTMQEMRDEQKRAILMSKSSVEKGEQIANALMSQFSGLMLGCQGDKDGK